MKKQRKFDEETRKEFEERSIDLEVASRYSTKFDSDDIEYLIENGIEPEIANSYSRYLQIEEICILKKSGINGKESRKHFSDIYTYLNGRNDYNKIPEICEGDSEIVKKLKTGCQKIMIYKKGLEEHLDKNDKMDSWRNREFGIKGDKAPKNCFGVADLHGEKIE